MPTNWWPGATKRRELFRHRQTMAGAVRFSTDELASLATRIAQSADAALELERGLFEEMAALALEHEAALGGIADALAVMDVSVALAELAVAGRYVRPSLDNGLGFKISARPPSGGGSRAAGRECAGLCAQ